MHNLQQNISDIPAPIFIMGIMQRSGTNFLNSLLLRHNDIDYPGIIWEDFFLEHINHLINYTEATSHYWQKDWKAKLKNNLGNDALLRSLGLGLLHFMESQRNTTIDQPTVTKLKRKNKTSRLITATPSVKNIESFFKLFDDAQLIIIIREGTALVESGVRSFNWEYEVAIRKWSANAKKILNFQQRNKTSKRLLIVKYEDLYKDTHRELKRIIHFLNLDIDKLDFDAVDNLGVLGSSDLKKGSGKMHWKQIKASDEFNPLSRSESWSSPLLCRFNWIAGQYAEQLGYQLKSKNNSFYWKVFNITLDIFFTLENCSLSRRLHLVKLIQRIRNAFLKTPKHS